MHYPFVLDYLQVVCTLKRLHLIDDGLFLDRDELLNLTACYSYFWFVFDHLGHAPWADNKHFKKGNNGREAQVTNGE